MTKETGTVKGLEILYFEEAEVQKTKGNAVSFAASGPLSVLYFKDYDRFVLQLNDWKYPLLHRLPITTTSERCYTLPALNGFEFKLKINSMMSKDALKNLETILMNNSRFAMKQQVGMMTKAEKSPDDKLMRHKGKDTSMMDKVTETAKNIMENIKAKTETMKMGTKHIDSTKKRTYLKDIKNKNFKKTAHPTFKKDFFDTHHKMTMDFMNKRKENPNMNHVMDFSDMKKTSENKAPTHFIFKEDLEEFILNNKDIKIM